jgi:2-C-methyl-D-erythritol 2,4-cyclodiphosphate synthase
MKNLRIGNGFDVHAMADGESLILAGVTIPSKKGTIAHSDGDVLIHALCDAILGAAGLGDIGIHFPDTNPIYKNISSLLLLEEVLRMIREAEFELINIDCTILLQEPKIQSFRTIMIQNLAKACSIEASEINIKATTTETLGFIGKEEGVAAFASVLLYKTKKL